MTPYRLHLHSDHTLASTGTRHHVASWAATRASQALSRARAFCWTHDPPRLLQVRVTGPSCWVAEIRKRAGVAHDHREGGPEGWDGFDGLPDALVVWGERPDGLADVPMLEIKP